MVNLPHVGDVSFAPGIRTPGRSAEARGVSASAGAAPGQSASPTAAGRAGTDSIELSAAARSAAGDRPIRADLVDRVRAEIANGKYDADEDAKLDVVADKLLKIFNTRV